MLSREGLGEKIQWRKAMVHREKAVAKIGVRKILAETKMGGFRG